MGGVGVYDPQDHHVKWDDMIDISALGETVSKLLRERWGVEHVFDSWQKEEESVLVGLLRGSQWIYNTDGVLYYYG